MTTRAEMCRNAADRLQREAYRKQMGGRNRPLSVFHPCEKGLVYTAELGRGCTRPQSLVTMEAALTHCECHKSLGEKDLIGYELPPP